MDVSGLCRESQGSCPCVLWAATIRSSAAQDGTVRFAGGECSLCLQEKVQFWVGTAAMGQWSFNSKS